MKKQLLSEILLGQSKEFCFDRPLDLISLIRKSISDSLGLHRVENPSHADKSVSLHLYSPPFDSCNMFDQRTGKKTACKVTFWSKFGQKVSTVYFNNLLIYF